MHSLNCFIFCRKSDENSSQQIQFLTIQDDFQETLTKMRSEMIELHQSLEEKVKELEKKNFIISELQLQVDKLDDELTDKGKVKKKISNFATSKLNFF